MRRARSIRPQQRRLILVALVALVAGSVACGGAGSGRGTTASSIEIPDVVTDESYPELARAYVRLSLDDPARATLRERMLAYLARKAPAALESEDYDTVIALFATMTDFLGPEDFDQERLPAELEQTARWVVEHGSPRGDEGRVLAALLILQSVDEDTRWRREYRRVARWGRQARSTLPSAIERYTRLIEVWEEHEQLTPAPQVASFLARLHVERRDAILQLMPTDGGRPSLPPNISPQDLRIAPQLLRRAPIDVAGIFLRHGDPASALTHVEAMGDVSGIGTHLARVLRDSRDGDDDATLELVDVYREGRPQVALGLCRHGVRTNPGEPRYVLCLARMAADAGDRVGATGWYSDTIALAPDERRLYDEALGQVAEFVREGRFDSDPTATRGIAEAAERILRERQRRWPDSEPDVAPERLHLMVGLLEMNAGNSDAARERFEASVEARETAEALLELGRLAERTGEPEAATRHYRRALDLTPDDGPLGPMPRAEILEHLGDAFRAAGNAQQARRMYRQALTLWDQSAPRFSGPRGAEIQLRRGVILDRLEQRADAVAAFRQAMDQAPEDRQVYARILSHLVVAQPDLQLATDVFGRAQRELTLEPEWKVYFALWLTTIAGRAGAAPNEVVGEVLESYSGDADWFGRLARFGSGELPYDELLAEADNVGQRTEAHFYEGTRLLARGDRDGADRQFRRVLETDMVNFYEFIMARELLTHQQ